MMLQNVWSWEKSIQEFVASKPIANVQQLYWVVELANALNMYDESCRQDGVPLMQRHVSYHTHTGTIISPISQTKERLFSVDPHKTERTARSSSCC